MSMIAGSKKTALVLLAAALLVVAAVTPEFQRMHKEEPIRKGPGVTEIKQLSHYFANLRGTNGDTAVYVMDSGKPGGTGLGAYSARLIARAFGGDVVADTTSPGRTVVTVTLRAPQDA